MLVRGEGWEAMNETVRLKMASGVDETAACGRLTIDLAALVENYRRLCRTAAPTPVAAVVKADAYGLAAAEVVPVLHSAGCSDFFVAHFIEAVRRTGVLR